MQMHTTQRLDSAKEPTGNFWEASSFPRSKAIILLDRRCSAHHTESCSAFSLAAFSSAAFSFAALA